MVAKPRHVKAVPIARNTQKLSCFHSKVGWTVGEGVVGWDDTVGAGVMVGRGEIVGVDVGFGTVGHGVAVGCAVGLAEVVGDRLGKDDGTKDVVGEGEGAKVGNGEGARVGDGEGARETVGAGVGKEEGSGHEMHEQE